MSIGACYRLIENRLGAAGLNQIVNVFDFSNTPSTKLDGSYFVGYQGSSLDSSGNKSSTFAHSFQVLVFFAGSDRDLSSVKEMLRRGEVIIGHLLDPVGLDQEIYSVSVTEFRLAPFDDLQNDDKMIFEINLLVKTALCKKGE